MSLGLWNLQWLNHNSQRSYPIADWASKECTLGGVYIPDDFILAINFAISSALTVDIDKFYIKAISISSTGASILLGYDGITDTVAITHIAIDDESPEIITAALTGVNYFDDTVGYIAVNSQSSIFSLTPGYYTFNYNGTALEPDCIRPMLRAVTSLQIQTSGGYSDKMYGDIVLVAGNNIVLDIVSTTPDRSVIKISAVNNDSYTASCPDVDNKENEAIKTINGVGPDTAGNVTIVGLSCVSVSSGDGYVELTDTCAQPCCGCPELNALEEQIQRVIDGKATLDTFVENLVSGVTALERNIIYGGK